MNSTEQIVTLQQPEADQAPSPNQTSTIKRTLIGFVLSIGSVLLNVVCNILVKKVTFFNAFEIALMMYVVTFIVMFTTVMFHKVNPLGPKNCRKLLVARGVLGPFSLCSMFISLKLIDPSDSIALFSLNVIFVAILSRIFLKEKVGVVHVFSTAVILTGVFLITQPSFFDPSKFHICMWTYLGMLLATGSALLYAIITIIFKRMERHEANIFVINIYSAYFGMPICFGVSLALAFTDYSKLRDFAQLYGSCMNGRLWLEILYLLISAILGNNSRFSVSTKCFLIQEVREK